MHELSRIESFGLHMFSLASRNRTRRPNASLYRVNRVNASKNRSLKAEIQVFGAKLWVVYMMYQHDPPQKWVESPLKIPALVLCYNWATGPSFI